MKRLFSILCLLAALAGCSAPLTLVSYNVGAFGKYTDNSIPAVAAALGEMGADLVALNEVDSCNRRHNVYQAQELSRALGGWEYNYASAFPFAGGAYGNAALSKELIVRSWKIALPKGEGSEPRSVAVIETDRCVFASVHLDYKSVAAQLEQVRIINEWFTQRFAGSRKPVFLCGDMNAEPDSPAIAALKEYWAPVSPGEVSFPSRGPRKCIDYIFALRSARRVKVRSAGVVYTLDSADLATASDHLPVRAVVR